MNYPLEKYKFYQFKNEKGGMTVSAVSSFAGRSVKGLAKCDPRDDFNIEKGKELAAARCNKKVAEKRLARATEKYMEAARAADAAYEYYDRMKQYYMDAVDQNDEAAAAIDALIKEY